MCLSIFRQRHRNSERLIMERRGNDVCGNYSEEDMIAGNVRQSTTGNSVVNNIPAHNNTTTRNNSANNDRRSNAINGCNNVSPVVNTFHQAGQENSGRHNADHNCREMPLPNGFDQNCQICIAHTERRLETFKMNHEKFRLASFRNWPLPFINVRVMAKNGFYYLGDGDVVKCNFCQIRLYRWDPNHIIEEEHLKKSPGCPLLRGHASGNIPMKARPLNLIVLDILSRF